MAGRGGGAGVVAVLLALGGPGAFAQNKGSPPAGKGQPARSAVGAMQGAGATGLPGVPGVAASGEPLPEVVTSDPEKISLAAFSEPVQLSSLVDLLAHTLGINVVVAGEVTGTVVFNAPVEVRKEEFLPLVDALLEQNGFTIVLDPSGFYSVRPAGSVGVNLEGEFPTTRVIATPNVRPTALTAAITAQMSALVPAGGQGASARALTAVDEVGIIVATDTPRRLDAIESLVKRILAEHAKSGFMRLEVRHVSAPVALQRVLALVGQAVPRAGQAGQVGGDVNAAARGTGLENLGERLTVDPQGNALVFRGVPEEIERVRQALALIDRPSELQPKRYGVGSAARQVADLARQRGLGEVTTIGGATGAGGFNPNLNQNFNVGIDAAAMRARDVLGEVQGGAVMVVDETKGTILYYATPEQHAQLDALITELDTQGEAVVIRAYRLENGKAADLATLINGLITEQTPAAENPLLPGGGGSFAGARAAPTPTAGERVEGELQLEGGRGFVIADEKNNQLLVKAPLKQQAEFERLIRRLDLRRPQVFVRAQIVAVTADDRVRVGFENQLINAGGSGGAFSTNFGIASTATDNILDAKVVTQGLSGFTAALIRSDQVPIAINALAQTSDTRIVASPQLLVDDNEEAEVVALDQQPTTSTSLGGGTGGTRDVTTFAGYQDAGTSLKVTPQISEGGYLRLKYEIELSSFSGEGSNGVPPPKQTNNIRSESVTVPSDFTVVVGGIVVDTKDQSYARVPLLGDIPLVGRLFGDTRDRDRKTVLYIFLTPPILRDQDFLDLQLLTRGARGEYLGGRDFPAQAPSPIDLRSLPGQPGAGEPAGGGSGVGSGGGE